VARDDALADYANVSIVLLTYGGPSHKFRDTSDCMFVLLPPPRVGCKVSTAALPGQRECSRVFLRRALLHLMPAPTTPQ
jgi:hypothetical protein